MKTELVQSLTSTFEAHAQQTESGVEYWLARDLQHLLGYAEWRNFSNSSISNGKTAYDVSGHAAVDHFVGVNHVVDPGSGSQRESARCPLTATRSTGSRSKLARIALRHYHSPHIRPLAVSPLTHPECVLSPWGFPVSGALMTTPRGAL